MNRCFKFFVVVLCIFSLALLPLNISAASDEKLYEKYGYQENFVYDDVMIGHALKSTVAKIFLHYNAEISYAPIIFDDEALVDDYITLYERYQDQYTEEEFVEAFIGYAQQNLDQYITYTGRKTVDTSASWTGSGVVISEDGYIATNAHVATINDESRKQLYLEGLQGEVLSDLERALDTMNQYGITISDSKIEDLYYIILEEAATRSNVIDEDVRLEVCFPDASGNTALDSAKIYEAKLVEEGTQDGIDGLTQDTAILKIDAENLVALKLSDSLPETNSTIVSAGFPGASDEVFQSSGSGASVLSVTVCTGQVSRIVPIDNSQYQAIEINTTISGGNSGGPSVDTGLNIEGLNTYVHGTDMRYAYMVSAEYVKTLTSDFNLVQDEATKTFLTGLQMLQQNYGDAAEECFERVKELQGNTPYIEKLIEAAQAAPDGKPETAGESIWSSNIILIVGIVVGVVIIILIIVLIIVMSKKKKRSDTTEKGDERPVPPPSPVTPVRPVSPPNPTPASPVYPQPDRVPPSNPTSNPYTSYGQPVNPTAPTSGLRSTMRTPAPKPEPEYKPEESSGGSRLIQSDNLKK
ncbi:MAG: trypsin-like peptidase domain-containing protein [Clostridia bacterium]|nr:trypsin-like peptidase domain-containing protein [Clostridia bacterium]